MEFAEILPYFSKERFIPELKATTKQEALEELAEKFIATDLIRNKDILIEMLQRRESVGSTGIGHGIAIPHGRTTATAELTVAFGKSTKGIAWDSIDKKPVKLIFLIVAPPYEEKNKYLPMLGTLVEFLSQDKNRKKLLKTGDFENFEQLLTQ
jgi:PTS system nitrogen regulatory IIA component